MGINIPSVREKVRYLSGGQRQAIALARFAAWNRRLILLDEPTAALGVRESAEALELIARLGREKGIATILIAHNLQHVYQVADRIVVLRHGEVVRGERHEDDKGGRDRGPHHWGGVHDRQPARRNRRRHDDSTSPQLRSRHDGVCSVTKEDEMKGSKHGAHYASPRSSLWQA